MSNRELDAEQILISYLSHKNFHSQLIDEQMSKQGEAQRIMVAVKSDIDSNDPKKEFWLRRDIKGRKEHKEILELLFELEKNIDHCLEVICSKYSLVITNNLNVSSLRGIFTESILKEFPQLISLVVEFHSNIDELHTRAQVLDSMEWLELDYDEAANIEEEDVDFGDSWDREIQALGEQLPYYSVSAKGENIDEFPDIEYDSDEELNGHVELVAQQLLNYYSSHSDKLEEIDLRQVLHALGNGKGNGLINNLKKNN